MGSMIKSWVSNVIGLSGAVGLSDDNALARGFQDPRIRGWIMQAAVLLLAALGIFELVQNTVLNLQKANIASGFGFLENPAGFAINFSLIDYSAQSDFLRAFFVGVLNTLLVAVLGILLATLIGFSVGIARLSPNWLVARLAGFFIETLRNIPLLLQLFFWYFVVLQLLPSQAESLTPGGGIFLNNRGLFVPRILWEAGTFAPFCVALFASLVLGFFARKRFAFEGWKVLGITVLPPLLLLLILGWPLSLDMPVLEGFGFQGGISLIPEFIALLLALSIYTGAFVAENVRSGVQAVPKGQVEAAKALGLPSGLIMRKIILPQAMRVIVPPLTSQYLNLTKNSSLAVAIAYPDLVLVFANTALSQVGQAVEIIAMTMAVYLLISLGTSLFMNWYNARLALKERGTA